VHITYPGMIERIARFPYTSVIDSSFWWDSINIIPEHRGSLIIDVYLQISRGKKKKLVRADNYKSTSHKPFTVFAAEECFPSATGWRHGDIHCHSSYTADQIEYGAPIEIMTFAAYCYGLQWIAVTDHSYDLDDSEDTFNTPDPLLMRWRLLRKKADLLAGAITVIPGEEVTCRTQNGKNCHLLALSSDKFIYGSGDGGEHNFDTKTEKTVGEAVSECVEWGGLACSAHPFKHISAAERLLLNRGSWTPSDLETPGITGIQFYNGIRDKSFFAGKKEWIRLLLDGKRIYAFGGSDAHGDLNRTRAIGIPLWSVKESPDHTLGCVRTVIYAESSSREHMLTGLRAGHAVVTDGPFIDLIVYSADGPSIPGDECGGESVSVTVAFRSSREFGTLGECAIIAGMRNDKTEKMVKKTIPPGQQLVYEDREQLKIAEIRYIRAECITENGAICFTNPVWFLAH
jgi:hypothetical protein